MTPLTDSPEYREALALLQSCHPKGCVLTDSGEVIDRAKVEKISDLKRLSELSRSPKELSFDLHGVTVSVQIRGLSSREAAQLDEMAEPRPPLKPKKDEKGRVIVGVEDFDFSDPKYRKEASDMFELKRAVIIAMGLPEMEIKGTAEEQLGQLRDQFPPHVLELLRTQIMSLTTTTIEQATFI
jgi:hypothetical protein